MFKGASFGLAAFAVALFTSSITESGATAAAGCMNWTPRHVTCTDTPSARPQHTRLSRYYHGAVTRFSAGSRISTAGVKGPRPRDLTGTRKKSGLLLPAVQRVRDVEPRRPNARRPFGNATANTQGSAIRPLRPRMFPVVDRTR
jgi:hypothetical protein